MRALCVYRVSVDPRIAHRRSLEASLTVQTLVYMCHDPKSMIQTLRFASYSVKYEDRHPRPPLPPRSHTDRACKASVACAKSVTGEAARRGSDLPTQLDRAAKAGWMLRQHHAEQLAHASYSRRHSLRTGSRTHTRVRGGGRAHGRVVHARRVL